MAEKQAKKTMTKEEMLKVMARMDYLLDSLNTAIVALYYIVNPSKDALKDINPDEYVKFVQETVHPIVLDADEIAKKLAEKVSKEAQKAVEE